jgi:flagellar basal body-associated protein FliL
MACSVFGVAAIVFYCVLVILTHDREEATTANTAAKQEKSIERIGALIRNMFDSDNGKVNATLDALHLDLKNDKKDI